MGIKQLYNLRKLPNEYGDVSVMYLLSMTQKSALILTCHKTPKRQMYVYTDVVFINGKDYTRYNADS